MRKNRVIAGRDTQDLTDFVNRLSIGKPYEIVNYKEVRNLDGNAITLAKLTDVVATLIKDLKDSGHIKEK